MPTSIENKENTAERERIRRCRVLGLSYADLSVTEAATLLASHAGRGERLAVFTPGATIAAEAARSPRLLRLLRGADLLLPDGTGSLLASRLAGAPLRHRAAGIDTAACLLPLANAYGMRLFLYGGRAEVVKTVAHRLSSAYSRLSIAYADGYGPDPYERISAYAPHIVFVCLGFPRQEEWIASHPALSAVCIGLGGSFDVWAGRLSRAPRIWQRMGLEWLWRTLAEPARLWRLLPLPRYFASCLAEGCRQVWQNSQKKKKKWRKVRKM